MKTYWVGLLLFAMVFQPALLLAEDAAKPAKKEAAAGVADKAEAVDLGKVTEEGANDFGDLDLALDEEQPAVGAAEAPAKDIPVVKPVQEEGKK